MTEYANNVHPIPPDHCAPDCDDQLPLIARVGRGPKGDSARLVAVDNCDETYLHAGYYDQNGEFHSEWVSENINGGELSYQYNLRPYTIPRTFTITFIYRRPGRHEWSWTTPAMPYIWSIDPNGAPEENPDHTVGSGVATLFVRTNHSSWNERLHYPINPDTKRPYDRSKFNAPQAEEGWSATITFGKGGDVEVPDFDELAKVIGVSKQDIFNIIEGNTININGINAKNVIDYVDQKLKSIDDLVNNAIKDYWKTIYPVGSLYLSFSSTSPQSLFGGTWQQITGYFLRAANDTSTGGEDSVTLTTDQLPNHTHRLGEQSYSVPAIEMSHTSWSTKVSSFTPSDRPNDFTVHITSTGITPTPPEQTMISTSQSAGSNVAHNNMPKYQDIYVWRRTA